MKKNIKLKITALIIIGTLGIGYMINQITVYPFIMTLRGFTSLVKEQGSIGPYGDTIKQVEETLNIAVPVQGHPDANLSIYRPIAETKDLPVILYIHGGGWSIGNASAVQSFAKLLSSNGYVVANLEYSLAPEHPYPTSTLQTLAALNYLYNHSDKLKIDASKIFVGGNSAGAHLSSQIGAIVTNKNLANKYDIALEIPENSLKGLLLFNGVYNFDTVGKSKFPGINKFLWSYTGEKNYLEYEKLDELSSLNYVTKNYPATFITVGDADPLNSQTREFIAKLKSNQVDHTTVLWDETGPKLNHDYIYELQTSEAQKAYKQVVNFLQQHSNDY